MSQGSGRPAKRADSAKRSKGKSDSRPASEPTSAAAIERQIQDRRAHLAATIDELALRAQPKEIARRTGLSLQARLREVTHTPEGELRTERLAAVGGAVVVVLGLMVALRRRRSKK